MFLTQQSNFQRVLNFTNWNQQFTRGLTASGSLTVEKLRFSRKAPEFIEYSLCEKHCKSVILLSSQKAF